LSARDDKKLPASLLAAYALPALPAAMLGLPLLIFLPAYYVETTTLSLTAIGAVLLVARLWDVAVDPAIGALSDRTHTRFGRRKPWILAALPFVLVGSFMLFDPPTEAGAGYLLLWLLVVYLGWSMVQIPHQAWGAELSSDYAERSHIAAWRESLTVIRRKGLRCMRSSLPAPSCCRSRRLCCCATCPSPRPLRPLAVSICALAGTCCATTARSAALSLHIW